MHRRSWFTRRMRATAVARFAVIVGVLASVRDARTGVINPDISVVGQPFARWTDDFGDPVRKRLDLDPGETEFVFDADLNPYARGTFIVALGDEGAELEEGFFVLSRSLPLGLSLKGGKYRTGFGKLNPLHPHVTPFAERFNVLTAYLPGEESFNETGLQLSHLVALPGDASLTIAADWLKGTSFRIEREPGSAANDPLLLDPDNGDLQGEPRPAMLGRVSAFVPVGDPSGFELGFSGTHGINNVGAGARTTVLGADLKAKIWNGERAYLVIQGEALRLDREEAGWDEVAAAYTRTRVKPFGGYVFADYSWDVRYNAGASYERWQEPTPDKTWNQSFGVFAGIALLEETTAFRFDWRMTDPGQPSGVAEDPEAVQILTLRVVYSMGPHKAHQF